MGRTSNAEYNRRYDNRNAGLGLLLFVLLLVGVFLIMPGMAILTAVVDVLALPLAPKQMWVISFVLSVFVFLFMRWRAYSFREAGRAYMSLSGIIALLFLLVHFGLETSFAARWVARFVPEEGTKIAAAKEPTQAATRVNAASGLLASLRPSVSGVVQGQPADSPSTLPPEQGSVPVRRAVAVTDDEPPFAALPLAPVVATTQGPAGSSTKYTITGIPFSDTLNVRAGPGANFAKIHELRPGYDKIVGVSTPQMNGDTEWVLITFENYSGWVARQFIRAE